MVHSNHRYTFALYFSLQAFEIAEKEFGILPVMSPQDMATIEVPDKLTMVSYLSQFYEYFRKDVAAANITKSETFLFFGKRLPCSKMQFILCRKCSHGKLFLFQNHEITY